MECSLATGFWLQDTLVTAGDRSKNEVVSDLLRLPRYNYSRVDRLNKTFILLKTLGYK